MPKIRFIKDTSVNGVKYKTGKALNVVKSTYNSLLKGNHAVDYNEPVEKKSTNTTEKD